MSSNTDIYGFPKNIGLYSAELEKDACGVGFIVNINGEKSNEVKIELYRGGVFHLFARRSSCLLCLRFEVETFIMCQLNAKCFPVLGGK